MYGHDSQPSKFYAYGAKAPTMNLDVVEDQMRRAHRYHNALVEVELERRKRVDAALVRLCPELGVCEIAIASTEGKVKNTEAEIQQARANARKRVCPPELTQKLKEIKARLCELRTTWGKMRRQLFATEAWKSEQETIDAWNLAERKRLRAESGLYWGTYLHVEQSMMGCRKGPPPHFHRWDGSGHLAVQLQSGLAVTDAFGTDTRLRIDPVPDKAWGAGGHALRRTRAHFRIGTQNGAPLWADVSIVLHRPLPADAQIKWAHLLRRRIGTHYEWRLSLVLTKPYWPKLTAATGHVGIDIGWRLVPDGLRVAYWIGDDGQEDSLMLPADWLRGMTKVRDLCSIRDKLLDEARLALAEWLREQEGLPDWLMEAQHTLHSWKSQDRLAALAIRWRTSRFESDGIAFDALEAWRKRDKHLYEWEANQREKLQRRREDIYRCFVKRLSLSYHTAHIEDMDLRKFHELPEVGEEEEANAEAMKEHVRDACLSSLRRFLSEAFAEVARVDPAQTTMECHACGEVQDFDRASIMRTCIACGNVWDQDRNAAINLLRAASADAVTAQ